jgi:mycofactocin precursor
MGDPTAPPAPSAAVLEAPHLDPELVEEDLLVEDVSIDGMCGVY